MGKLSNKFFTSFKTCFKKRPLARIWSMDSEGRLLTPPASQHTLLLIN